VDSAPQWITALAVQSRDTFMLRACAADPLRKTETSSTPNERANNHAVHKLRCHAQDTLNVVMQRYTHLTLCFTALFTLASGAFDFAFAFASPSSVPLFARFV